MGLPDIEMLSCEWDLATFYQWLTVIVILFCLTAAQIAVMITNGRSDDQVDAAAGAVADNGISLFAVGEYVLFYFIFYQGSARLICTVRS